MLTDGSVQMIRGPRHWSEQGPHASAIPKGHGSAGKATEKSMASDGGATSRSATRGRCIQAALVALEAVGRQCGSFEGESPEGTACSTRTTSRNSYLPWKLLRCKKRLAAHVFFSSLLRRKRRSACNETRATRVSHVWAPLRADHTSTDHRFDDQGQVGIGGVRARRCRAYHAMAGVQFQDGTRLRAVSRMSMELGAWMCGIILSFLPVF